MQKRLIVVGDIHGELDKLNRLLNKIDRDEDEYYVFVGDYIDRGNDSLGVIRRLMELEQSYFIIGNHDAVFLDFIRIFKGDINKISNSDKYSYMDFAINYMIETFHSFLVDIGKEGLVKELALAVVNEEYEFIYTNLNKIAKEINDNFKDEIDFLKKCLLYLETDKYVISHSGGNKKIKVSENYADDWLWSRDFSQPINNKIYIYGHTPTNNSKVTISGKNVNVDVGAVFRGIELGYYKTNKTIIL